MDGLPQTQHAQAGVEGLGTGPAADYTPHKVDIICGPLLNYKHMSDVESGRPNWHGSVLVVTTPGQRQPELTLAPAGAVRAEEPETSFSGSWSEVVKGEKLYEDPGKAFWRFLIHVPFQKFESRWEYRFRGLDQDAESTPQKPQVFAVPPVDQSMRILFHSCNGFSVGTDVESWAGPALWNDVLRMHEVKPFHVMIGGGDQIYNDGVRVDGPLKPWTDIGNPHKRHTFPFPEKLRQECDEYYYQNYVRWYGKKPFADANGQIPQINIWDDHDIIDGFGSYTDHFMRCPVFRGIGGVAHKYYMLFQHHIAPPKSTYTTDAPTTMDVGPDGSTDPVQLKGTFVMTNDVEDPSYIIGDQKGPYVEEKSRSIYCQLGARIAFCGIDARIERTRHQINYPETYAKIFGRLNRELSANRDIKHLVLLLGVPIAYPRLQWLENIFSSPIIAPIKFLNRRFGFGGTVFNKFDGNVDLLDDLDDHYTAHQHKRERRELVLMLQNLSRTHSVRITILGGDVHLAAVGRFYSNPTLGIPAEQDFRYMPNVISSAITNKPPPQAIANLLARRNKIHHLDQDTDETLLEIFNRDPGKGAAHGANGNGVTNGAVAHEAKVSRKTSDWNHATMPSRNYAIIAESNPTPTLSSSAPAPAQGAAPTPVEPNASTGAVSAQQTHSSSPPPDKRYNHRKPIHAGEHGAGTEHPAAQGLTATGLCGPYGLDVTLRVEIRQGDPAGRTDGYGFSVPALEGGGFVEQGERW
ncbi:uncharacterized protein EI97DRAFT_395944 [Westerdykella ornata]|uniref:PhoD-like phosphatase domain-containing protein n=1 Tax=Westerdykella ornata TaxID=318751 RepID=A0A6A6JKY0_WESOR|nr:uncharacterized protein EI97DRAFT_395944 [Westerdykella ornata]KAF2277310.1 hypothetical protein EI97DRAFT_395944 [Westerdykella ornata]